MPLDSRAAVRMRFIGGLLVISSGLDRRFGFSIRRNEIKPFPA
jgi:hypothetical protein